MTSQTGKDIIAIKCGGETIPRLFSKKIKIEHIPGSTVQIFIQFVLIVWQVEGYLKILKLTFRSLAFTLYKAFLKNKKRSGTSLPGSFFAWLLKKNSSAMF